MKGVVVTTEAEVEVHEFTAPLHESVGKAVGGWIEIVHPMCLKRPYVMIVNEEGLLQDLDMNVYGSLLYGAQIHGQPIVGNVVIMKEGFVDGEPDIVGLSDDEASKVAAEAKSLLKAYHQAKEAAQGG